jgi:hypothetical protein
LVAGQGNRAAPVPEKPTWLDAPILLALADKVIDWATVSRLAARSRHPALPKGFGTCIREGAARSTKL